jgi:hypothetical protein
MKTWGCHACAFRVLFLPTLAKDGMSHEKRRSPPQVKVNLPEEGLGGFQGFWPSGAEKVFTGDRPCPRISP